MGWGAKSPKMDGVNRAAEQNAATQARLATLAEQEFAAGNARANELQPIFRDLMQQQVEMSRSNNQRSDEIFGIYRDTYLPAEKLLAEKALNYDTLGRRNEAAESAAGEVSQQFGNARAAQMRALGRTGGQMNSGRQMVMDAGARLEQAKATAGAKVAARQQVENTGLALLDNTVKTGRGLPSVGLQAGQMALAGAQGAGNTLGQEVGARNASLAPALSLYNGSVGAGSSAGNLALGAVQAQQAHNNSSMAGLAGLGSLAGMIGGAMIMSSKDSKTKKRKPRGLEEAALEGVSRMPVEGWDYKPGMGDGGTHIGPYAEDAQREFGDAVAPGGKAIDMHAMGGKNQLALGALLKRLERMEQQLGVTA